MYFDKFPLIFKTIIYSELLSNIVYFCIITRDVKAKGLMFMGRWHWFQFVSGGILTLFLSILVYVVVISYTRRSGSTGLDVATIQKIRYEAIPQRSSPPSIP